MQTPETPQCDLCKTAMRQGRTAWHFICRQCGLEKTTLIPQINEIQTINETQRAQALQNLRTHNFATLLSWLGQQCANQRPAGQRPTLLEVGCAHGWFLQQAQANYAAQGIEADHAMAQQTRAKGMAVRSGLFPHILKADERFDLIVFNDVLEHIPHVSSVLQHCHQHLNPGGYVVINAPDSEGIFYRLSKWLTYLGLDASFKRMWQWGLPSPHLYYFNTATLKKIATANHFSMHSTMPLPSITLDGLIERIQYTGNHSKIKSWIIFYLIKTFLPWLQAAKPDIRVWLLKKE